MLPIELEEYFVSIGEQSFRAKQVYKWLHNGARAFVEMTNLSLDLRSKLNEHFVINSPELIMKLESKLDGTKKYLWRINGDDAIESVLMDFKHGSSVCLSTQVGCKMGCTFCASSIGGFVRNLNASDMLNQVLFSQLEAGKRVSNVVLMGIGEPLDNFDNVIRFIKIICHPFGMNISARHITLSTCGVVENIDRLAVYGVQLTLAVSLHAPDDETRTKLLPINRDTGVRNLIDACERYFSKTGRRVTYEYAMISGVNDSPAQAESLSELLNNTGSHLNLIKLSDIPESDLRASPKENVEAFTDVLSKKKVNFTFRRSLGTDIDASCGQLRNKTLCNGENIWSCGE